MLFHKILSCLGAFFVVFLLSAIGFGFAGMDDTRGAGTLALIAAVVTWFVFPTKEASTEPIHEEIEKQSAVSGARKQKAVDPESALPTVEVTDAHWEMALNEYEHGQRNDGLFARLFTECEGDEARIKAAYLKERSRAIAVGDTPQVRHWPVEEPELSSKKKL